MEKTKVGMIGLAVMGQNLARNLESKGYSCSVFNRTHEVTSKFMANNAGCKFFGAKNIEEFVESLERPRKMFIMIKAGEPVDEILKELMPLLSEGDIIIDGGNAYFEDTIRREKMCTEKNIQYLGVGISGGEVGALTGPSIMPGGPKKAWEQVSDMFSKIAAFADEPCTSYIGPDGSGHFVKMVHNGIEYADMQLIAESYDLLSKVIKLTPPELSQVFSEWNKGVLQSYLIEITAKIFAKLDPDGDGYLVDKILDKAGQKGTGRWTAQTALDLGVPIPTIVAAVDARALSSIKSEREEVSVELEDFEVSNSRQRAYIADINKDKFIKFVHDALYSAKILAYAQGMQLLAKASEERKWDLKLGEIASLWKGGCIIRARFLTEIKSAYSTNAHLTNLILAPSIKRELAGKIEALREVNSKAALFGIPVLGFSTSLSYFDSYRSLVLPQKLTQAQRDFFGAHTYERIDRPGIFHTEWE